MPRATELVLDTGVVVYDTLFVVLAEYTGTVMVTADDKLLRTLQAPSVRALHTRCLELIAYCISRACYNLVAGFR